MSLCFPPFRLELGSEQLWREDHAIPLRPKTFAVLRYLTEHPAKLVTKDELLDTVWAGTIVGDTVLKSCIRELREALGDDVQMPHFIATVHRRGYRWVAPLSTTPLQGSGVGEQGSVRELRNEVARRPEHAVSVPNPGPRTPFPILVGREAELAQLQSWLDKALSGQRQLVFVTGEAGIGKTALVDVFLQTLVPSTQHLTPSSWLGRGQCIEQYGAGEAAYMPILEALGRLCREPGGERLIALLNQHAPTWLVQMSTLLSPTELELLQRKVQGATRERMLREMAEAIDRITAECPLVLWLEDLHWSDPSTLELLALLARRREPARLFVIGTYRPVDVIVKEHPLKAVKQELQLHGQCAELAVRLLSEEHIAEYLTVRLRIPSARAGEGHGEDLSSATLLSLAHAIHERTEGNPLFIVNVVDELLAHEQIDPTAVEVSTPATIRQMIERQLERLSAEEQRLLEAASVAGMEFSAAAVAAGTEATLEAVEERCGALARRGQFLRTDGTAAWPDGTVTTQYGFLHALYQEVTYERVPAGRRAHLHQCLGERMEAAYGERTREIAAELAVHFERGRDYRQAVQYLQRAGGNALGRSAYKEAITLLTKGLELLKALPDAPERGLQELLLLRILGPALISLKGFAAGEVEQTYARASDLCQQDGNAHERIYVLQGLQIFHLVRGEVHKAREFAEQGFQLAQHVATSTVLMAGHAFFVEPLYWLGELTTARAHLEQAWELYNPQEHNLRVIPHWIDLGVGLLSYLTVTSGLLGYPDQAQQRLQEGLALADELSHPYSSASVLIHACLFHSFRKEWQQAKERAEAAIRLASEQGFPYLFAQGTVLRGQALIAQGKTEEGITQIQQSLIFFQSTGAKIGRPKFLALLAEAHEKMGKLEEGIAQLVEALALVEQTGERIYEAELYRLKGELLLAQEIKSQKSKSKSQKSKITDLRPLPPDPQGEAEACFLKAIEIAQRQQAKSWELRASTSLARLWQSQGKTKEAHKMLSEIYGWFTEGFDTRDLQEAKALVEELSY